MQGASLGGAVDGKRLIGKTGRKKYGTGTNLTRERKIVSRRLCTKLGEKKVKALIYQTLRAAKLGNGVSNLADSMCYAG